MPLPTWLDSTGLRTNRVKQMAKLNEICYEAVIEQVRKGLQPLSCFWSCYLADTHEQPSNTCVIKMQSHWSWSQKSWHQKLYSTPKHLKATDCSNFVFQSTFNFMCAFCCHLWAIVNSYLATPCLRHLFDSSATLSFDDAGHQVMVFVHSRGDTFKTVTCLHLFIRFNSAESPERMKSETFSEYIWPDLTGTCFFFSQVHGFVLYMVKVFAAHLHRLTQDS